MKETILVSSVFRLSSDAVMEQFDDGALILQNRTLALTELNTTARDILANTDGNKTAGQVADVLAELYEIEPGSALQDVLALYSQLAADQILEELHAYSEEEANG